MTRLLNRNERAVRLLTLGMIVLALLFSFGAASAQSGSPPAGNPPVGGPPGGSPPGGAGASGSNEVTAPGCGATTMDGEAGEATSGQNFDSTAGDQSALCVINGGSLTVNDAVVTKTGETSSADQSSFYGLNAAVLVGAGSSLTMTGGTVTTDGSGANGVFSTGSGASVVLNGVTIDANGDGAHAVMATLGGDIDLTNVDMNTTGAHSGAIATDRGSGTINVTGGTVTTSGQDSPGIYSTGAISLIGSAISATGAESAVIEGGNSITLVDSSLTSSLEDKWGVMIYQSFSGDAEGTHGTFTMTGGSLSNTASTGPLFFVTNGTATIILTDVEVNVESGVLAQAGATDRWGTAGQNGGAINLMADNQDLTGDLVADSISSLAVTLKHESSLTGAINAEGTALGVSLTLDDTSEWNVAGDSVLTSLDGVTIENGIATNIYGNGYTVIYDATASPALNGGTYELADGGVLQPAVSG